MRNARKDNVKRSSEALTGSSPMIFLQKVLACRKLLFKEKAASQWEGKVLGQ